MALYNLHQPQLVSARSKFESGASTAEQFLKDLNDVRIVLKESIDILAGESNSSPEAIIRRTAQNNFNNLNEEINRVTNLGKSAL